MNETELRILKESPWTGTHFKLETGMEDSIERWLHYLANISKEPLQFSSMHPEMLFQFEPPKAVVVSQMLYRYYSCMDYNCSRCCHHYWNCYTSEQGSVFTYDELQRHTSPPVWLACEINGRSQAIMLEDHTAPDKTKNGAVCGHLKNNRCTIWSREPIHCAYPVMKFKRIKDTTYITREYYGRNQYIKCPVGFVREGDSKHIFETVYKKLERMELWAEEWGIETHIESILSQVMMKINELRVAEMELPSEGNSGIGLAKFYREGGQV